MARRKIETLTVPGSIIVDLNSGKTLEKALSAVICSRTGFSVKSWGWSRKSWPRRSV